MEVDHVSSSPAHRAASTETSFASLLIAKELNVVFVSRQHGHSSPAITLRVYAHLFEQGDRGVAAREASYAAMPSATGARPTPVSAGST